MCVCAPPQTLRNLADLDGAPRLITDLDVNSMSLNNLRLLNGAPTLGATLDVNQQDLVNVQHVRAPATLSVLMDSVTQFNDDLDVNGQTMRNTALIEGAPTMGDTLSMGEQTLDNVALAVGANIHLSSTDTTDSSLRATSAGGVTVTATTNDMKLTADTASFKVRAFTNVNVNAGTGTLGLSAGDDSTGAMLLQSAGGVAITSDSDEDIVFEPHKRGRTGISRLELRTDADVNSFSLVNAALVTGADVDFHATGASSDSLKLRSDAGVALSGADDVVVSATTGSISASTHADTRVTSDAHVTLSAAGTATDAVEIRSLGGVAMVSGPNRHIEFTPQATGATKVSYLQLSTIADVNDQTLDNTALVKGQSISVKTEAGDLTLTGDNTAVLRGRDGDVVVDATAALSLSSGISTTIGGDSSVAVSAGATGTGTTAGVRMSATSGGLSFSTGGTQADSAEFLSGGGVTVASGNDRNIVLHPDGTGSTQVRRLQLTTDADLAQQSLTNAGTISGPTTADGSVSVVAARGSISLSSRDDLSVTSGSSSVTAASTTTLALSSLGSVSVVGAGDVVLNPASNTIVEHMLLSSDGTFSSNDIDGVAALRSRNDMTLAAQDDIVVIPTGVTSVSQLKLATAADADGNSLVQAAGISAGANLALDLNSPSEAVSITPAGATRTSRLALVTAADLDSNSLVNAATIQAPVHGGDLLLTSQGGADLQVFSSRRFSAASGLDCDDAVQLQATSGGGVQLTAGSDIVIRPEQPTAKTRATRVLLASNTNFAGFDVTNANTITGSTVQLRGSSGRPQALTLSADGGVGIYADADQANVFALQELRVDSNSAVSVSAEGVSVAAMAGGGLDVTGDTVALTASDTSASTLVVQAVSGGVVLTAGTGDIDLVPTSGDTLIRQLSLDSNADLNNQDLFGAASIFSVGEMTVSSATSVVVDSADTIDLSSGTALVSADDSVTVTSDSGDVVLSSNQAVVLSAGGDTLVSRAQLQTQAEINFQTLKNAASITGANSFAVGSMTGDVSIIPGGANAASFTRLSAATDVDVNHVKLFDANELTSTGTITLSSGTKARIQGVAVSIAAANAGIVAVSGDVAATSGSDITLQPDAGSFTNVRKLKLGSPADAGSMTITNVQSLTGDDVAVVGTGDVSVLASSTVALTADASMDVSASAAISAHAVGPMALFTRDDLRVDAATDMRLSSDEQLTVRGSAQPHASSYTGIHVDAHEADIVVSPADTMTVTAPLVASGTVTADVLDLSTGGQITGANVGISGGSVDILPTAGLHVVGNVVSVASQSIVLLSAVSGVTATGANGIALTAAANILLSGDDQTRLTRLRLESSADLNGQDLTGATSVSATHDLRLQAASDIVLLPGGGVTSVYGTTLTSEWDAASADIGNAAGISGRADMEFSCTGASCTSAMDATTASVVGTEGCPDAVDISAPNGGVLVTAASTITLSSATAVVAHNLQFGTDMDANGWSVTGLGQISGSDLELGNDLNVDGKHVRNVAVVSGNSAPVSLSTDADADGNDVDAALIAMTNLEVTSSVDFSASGGLVTASDISPGGVTSSEILDGTIVADDIDADEVVSGVIAQDTITAAEIKPDAVTSDEILDDSITSDDILDGTIATADFGTGAVTSTHIATLVGADFAATLAAGDFAVATITGVEIADGAVDSSELATDSVGTRQILDATIRTVDFDDGAVDSAAIDTVATADILDGTVVSASIAQNTIVADDIATNAVRAREIASGAVESSDLASNSVRTEHFAANSVTTAEILDDAVTTAILSNGVVTSAHIDGIEADDIAAGAVTTAAIQNGAVGASQIVDGTITTADFRDGQVTSAHLPAGSVDTTEIGANAVTSSRIQNQAVTTAKLDADVVVPSKIADGAVVSAAITDANVGTSEVNDAAVLQSHIKPGAVTSDELDSTTCSVDSEHIDAQQVVSAKVAPGIVVADDVSDGAIGTAQLAASAVTSAKMAEVITSADIKDGTITSADINDGDVSTDKLEDSSVTDVELAAAAVDTVELADGQVMEADIAAGAVTGAAIGAGEVDETHFAATADVVVSTVVASGAVTGDRVQFVGPSDGVAMCATMPVVYMDGGGALWYCNGGTHNRIKLS